MDKKDYKISVIIPVYNSEKTIGLLVDEIIKTLVSHRFEILLINDYSTDRTHDLCLQKYTERPDIVRYYRLSKNFGEHNAVIVGLNEARGDYAVILDDDFQNPPDEIPRMLASILDNRFDVLYTFFADKKHHVLRNIGSWFNNLIATYLMRKPFRLYLSSFKIINRFTINEVIKYRGPYPYIDGLILRVTRNIGQIEVRHEERRAGRSGYTLKKLLALWLNMFINFSVVPLRTSFFIGFLLTVFGIGMILYFVLAIYVLNPNDVWPPGWPSLIVSLVTFSGTQLMILGLIGEYVGKLFLTDNGTPQYAIRERYEKEAQP